MNKKGLVIKTALAIFLITVIMFSCKHKNNSKTSIGVDDESKFSKNLQSNLITTPQIINIIKSPDRLTKEVNTYTVTLLTEGNSVKLEDTEFSIDGKIWQKSPEFTKVLCGNNIFYARNKRDKLLLDQKEMYLECFVDVPLPTIQQLNDLLKQIADCDDNSSDELRKFGKNLPVKGVANVNTIEQLLRNACINGVIYVVQKIETDESGNIAAIIIVNNQ